MISMKNAYIFKNNKKDNFNKCTYFLKKQRLLTADEESYD